VPAALPPTLAIDWRAIHRRLEAARTALAEATMPTPEAQHTLLRSRAQALAREPPRAATSQDTLDIVEFRLASETYGVEVSHVREVSPLRTFTPLPCTPPFVLGIVNLRGQLLSVIDLKPLFALPARRLTDRHAVIVLQAAPMAVGLLADAILGVRSMPLEGLQPPLPTLIGRRAAYLKGVTHEPLVLLDAAKLLADPTLRVMEEVEGDTP
jgi:purine-binding chemotaxis protein CheW